MLCLPAICIRMRRSKGLSPLWVRVVDVLCLCGPVDHGPGYIFPYPSRRTWEWTSASPIRSFFPLWPVYGVSIVLLQWTWGQDDNGLVEPAVIYYVLRLVMFVLSFVLEDWAIYELVHSPRQRIQTVLLVASSYVTWTFQTHTFSNSIETLLVLWSLVLIERIVNEKVMPMRLGMSMCSFICGRNDHPSPRALSWAF